jgi:outer membrane lipoprotein-sorting protein
MIISKRLAICLIFTFVGSVLSAQSEKEIVAKYTHALGQMSNDSAGQTFTAKGKFTMQGISMPTLFYWRFPKNVRIEMNIGKATFKMISNDSIRWEYNPMTKKSKTSRLDPESEDDNNTFDFVHKDLLNYKKMNHKLKLVGKRKLDSLEVFELKLIKGKKEESTIFISTSHFLIHKVVDGKGTRFFANYYFHDQFLFPRFVVEETKRQHITVEFDDIEFNKIIPDSLFVIPQSDVEPTGNNAAKRVKLVAKGRKSMIDKADDFLEKKSKKRRRILSGIQFSWIGETSEGRIL